MDCYICSLGEENKLTLLELGAVEPLFKLVSHEEPVVRRNATMVLGIMASHSKSPLFYEHVFLQLHLLVLLNKMALVKSQYI